MLKYIREILRRPAHSQSRVGFGDILFFTNFVKPLWKLGLATLILTIVTTALSTLLPLSSKVFIDFVIMRKGFDALEAFLRRIHLDVFFQPIQYALSSVDIVVLLMLAIGIVIGLIRIVQNVITVKFQQEITFNIQTALFDHLLRFPLSFLKEKQVGYLMSRVSNDVSALQFFFSGMIPRFLTNIFSLVFSLGILFTLNSRISLILFSAFPLWCWISYFFASRVRAISHQTMEKQAQVSKDMQEMLSGAEVIKANVSEQREVSKISVKIRKLFRIRLMSSLLSSLSGSAMQAVKLLVTLGIVWLSVHEIRKGGMSIGDMTALMAYTVYLSGIISSLSGMFLSLQTIFAAVERLMEMFNVIPEFAGNEKAGIQPETIRGKIRFDRVSFSYEKDSPVLNDISFTVCPGDIIALTGQSGAGKTTLINLLIKFYPPGSGTICLDDHDLNNIDTRWLRKQLGFVSQDIFLFNDTVENNIKYGKPSADPREVIRAARNANIHEDIEKLENGYQTMVGERGIKLSVGQRQRISIARAFLKDPRILIFDEPTSALDTDTEQILKDSLKKLARNRTVFMITHRMSVTDVANRMFVLEAGKVVEK